MTIGDVIDALGGNGEVAALFGVGPSAVSNWRALNRFPARLHYRIAKACEARGIGLDERLFADHDAPTPEQAAS